MCDMEKKLYMMPQTNVVEIKTKVLLAGSQFDIPVSNPNDEVDAGNALSRGNHSIWDEDEEE